MMTITDEDMAACELPQTLQELLAVVTWAEVMLLVKHYGGVNLPVLRGAAEDHPAVTLLGRELVAKLATHYGMERPYIPRAHHALACMRNRALRAEYDAGGVTGDDLARKYQISNRRVWEILGQPDEAPTKQRSLFGGGRNVHP